MANETNASADIPPHAIKSTRRVLEDSVSAIQGRNNNNNTTVEDLMIPLYGTKEYWEARYKRVSQQQTHATCPPAPSLPTSSHMVVTEHPNGAAQSSSDNHDNDNEDNNDDDNDDDDLLAYHAWYFTYNDLRPLILPLILGGPPLPLQHDDDGDDGDDDDDDDDDPSSSMEKENDEESLPAEEFGNVQKAEPGQEDEPSYDKDHVQKQHDNNNKQQDDDDSDEPEEVQANGVRDDDDGDFETIQDDNGNDDEEGEELEERTGLAKSGPISILEIGCGDVPLGAGLAKDLLDYEIQMVKSAREIVKQILCIDYSPSVVQMMREQYCQQHPITTATTNRYHNDIKNSKHHGNKKRKIQAPSSKPDNNVQTVVGHIPLEFATVDARQLPYPDESIELILEKGTLDAMLSDLQHGEENCIQIMAECARVMTKGGYMVLVSHLNAHTPAGIAWLEGIVFLGLQTRPDAAWEIEVHGNDEVPQQEESGSPGPAVYIIHKMAAIATTKTDSSDKGDVTKMTIPVKFFSY